MPELAVSPSSDETNVLVEELDDEERTRGRAPERSAFEEISPESGPPNCGLVERILAASFSYSSHKESLTRLSVCPLTVVDSLTCFRKSPMSSRSRC